MKVKKNRCIRVMKLKQVHKGYEGKEKQVHKGYEGKE